MNARTAQPASPSPLGLRQHAISRLAGSRAAQTLPSDASAALRVLHDLAASPDTAADALALLHELQVHQVELELQAEELRNSRLDLEAALARQTERYEHAPVALFTVDGWSTIIELNRAAARLLGQAAHREAWPGMRLDSLLLPRSADMLHTLLARAAQGHAGEPCTLQLRAGAGAVHEVSAEACREPAGGALLVAFSSASKSRNPSSV
jgi:PAS domain-containing protein